MDRRQFVRRASLGAVTAAVAPRMTWAGNAGTVGVRRLTRIGIQAYGVRRELARDLAGTLSALRRIGYSDIEINWHLGMTPSPALSAALAASGLRASSAHTTGEAMLVGWERHLDAAAAMGLEQLVCPGFSADARQSLDDWREWADRLNAAGAAAQRHGIRVAYHTEPDVFAPIAGQVPLDVFAERLDPNVARLQLDVGNIAMAGVDPLIYADRYADRVWSLHLKDVPVIGKMGDTELGAGKLDFKRILSAVKDPDHTLFFVEQENARAPLESARADYDYISKLEF